MTLPTSVARCPGMQRTQPTDWPFPQEQAPDCLMDCARRRQGIADFMAGETVQWMVPPKDGACTEQLRPKR